MEKLSFSSTELAVATRASPQERLAASRKALVRHMSHDARPEQRLTLQGQTPEEGGGDRSTRLPSSESLSSRTLGVVRRGLQTWWRHHPANFAVSVAQPFLGRYASESPFRLLAISAGVGAAVAVIKPWRLFSMGGIAMATLKSSQFSGLVMSMLSSQPNDGPPPSA